MDGMVRSESTVSLRERFIDSIPEGEQVVTFIHASHWIGAKTPWEVLQRQLGVNQTRVIKRLIKSSPSLILTILTTGNYTRAVQTLEHLESHEFPSTVIEWEQLVALVRRWPWSVESFAKQYRKLKKRLRELQECIPNEDVFDSIRDDFRLQVSGLIMTFYLSNIDKDSQELLAHHDLRKLASTLSFITDKANRETFSEVSEYRWDPIVLNSAEKAYGQFRFTELVSSRELFEWGESVNNCLRNRIARAIAGTHVYYLITRGLKPVGFLELTWHEKKNRWLDVGELVDTHNVEPTSLAIHRAVERFTVDFLSIAKSPVDVRKTHSCQYQEEVIDKSKTLIKSYIVDYLS